MTEENFTVVPAQPVSAESKPSNKPDSPILRSTQTLLTREQIFTRIEELAHEISLDYKEVLDEELTGLVVVGVLNGAVYFTCDLTRYLAPPITVGFMQLSSYRDARVSSGKVDTILHPNVDVKGRHVLVVEDVLDTGSTVRKIREIFEKLEPASLKIAVFADKQTSVEKVDYIGFKFSPKDFLIGYGMDSSGILRNLTQVLAVEK